MVCVSLSANLGSLSTAGFFGGAGSGLQERFRSLTRAVDRNALANKPAAGHLMMADADKVQMARRGPGIHWGRCTAQWRCSQ